MEKVCHNPRQQTVLHPKHHCCGPILQKFSSTKSTGSGLSSQGHIATLGPSAGQNALVSHVTPRRPPLASCCSSLPVQEHGAGLQGCQRTELHPSTSKHWSDHTLQREHFPLLHQLGWLVPPSLRTNKVHSVKSRLFSVLAPQLVERTPNQCQNSRITHHLRQKIQDSLAQTSPWPHIA